MEQIMLKYPVLNDIFGRLQGGEVILLAARPGMGKTWLTERITAELASGQHKKARIFSLEGSDSGMSMDDIYKEVSAGHFDFIVVDFLQKLSHLTVYDRTPDIKVMKRLHGMAKKQNVSVLVLSTVSRRTDRRQDYVPRIADSPAFWGVLPYMDVVLFLLWEGYYDQLRSETEDDILIIPHIL